MTSTTSFPGVARYDALQALGCIHCGRQLEVRLSTSRCPMAMYEVQEAFAKRHAPCREYADHPHLAAAAMKANKLLHFAKSNTRRG